MVEKRLSYIRCKWYKDDSDPVSGGCKHQRSCEYSHPEDDTWDRAMRKHQATDRPPMRKDSGRGDRTGSSNSSRSANKDFDVQSWASSKGKERERDKESGWGTGGWGNSPRDKTKEHSSTSVSGNAGWGSGSGAGGWSTSSTSNEKGKEKKDDGKSGWGVEDTSGGWGTSNTTNGWGTGTAGDSEGWGTSTNDSSGWGNDSSATKGWDTGSSGASEWGASKKADTGTGGWGPSSTGGWGTTSASATTSGGWGIPTSAASTSKPGPSSTTSSRRSSIDQPAPTLDPRKGKERDRAAASKPFNLSIRTQNSPSQSTLNGPVSASRDHQGSAGGSSTMAASVTQGEGLRTPVTPMGPPPLPSASSRGAGATKPPALPSRASSTMSSKELLDDAQSIKRSSAKRDKADKEKQEKERLEREKQRQERQMRAAQERKELQEMKAKTTIMRADLTPEERSKVYHQVIRLVQQLIYLQIRYRKFIHADKVIYKKTGAIPLYQHTGTAARQKITDGRAHSCTAANKARSQYKAALRELVSLPDIPSQSTKTYDPAVDRQKIMDYTLELKKWVQDLDLPKRMNALRIARQPPPPTPPRPAPSNPNAMEVDGPVSPIHDDGGVLAEPFPKRQGVTLGKLKEVLDELQDGVADARTCIEDWDNVISDVQSDLERQRKALRQDRLEKQKEAVLHNLEEEKPKVTKLDDGVKALTALSESLNKRKDAFHAELAEMKARTAALNESNAELERELREAEAKQKSRAKLFVQLTQDFRAVVASSQAPPPPPPAPKPRPVRDITIDDIAPEIREEIINKLKAELQPVLDGLVNATNLAGDDVKAALEKMMEPVIVKTERVRRRAQAVSIPS